MGVDLNDLPSYFVVVLWLATNAYLFLERYIAYSRDKQYFYLKYILKGGLPFSRGSAAVLQFNCMLIVLTVCRNLLTLIKSIPFLPRCISRIFDKNIAFHKMVGWMICFATLVHAGGHVYNFESLVASWSRDRDDIVRRLKSFKDGNLLCQLTIFKDNLDPLWQLMQTTAGVTGLVVCLALVVMVSTSSELIRRRYYEVFWYTHHFFVVFFLGLLLHGFQGILRYQDNTTEHDPEVCSRAGSWNVTACRTPPHFRRIDIDSWKWVCAPVAIYCVERIVRYYRSQQPCTLLKIVQHPSNVIELRMRKPGFTYKVGQYVFLQCPNIARYEWHPYTLTSCPEDDHFTVHVRVMGDWTHKLAARCAEVNYDAELFKYRIYCDGPFRTACSDVFRYKTIICVGAHIGVTPFASVLKSIYNRLQREDHLEKVNKVYFYWICPKTESFEWFAGLLKSFEDRTPEKGGDSFLEYELYLTRGWTSTDIESMYLHNNDLTDNITGLNQKTRFGRPVWTKIFGQIRERHKGSNVGVFCCGPEKLSNDLHLMSRQFSDGDTNFYYNKENFE